MRRAAVQVLRTAQRSHARRHLNSRVFSTSGSHPALARSRYSPSFHHRGQPLPILQSSMYFTRGLAIAFVSSLAAYGGWYYRETSLQQVGSPLNPTTSSPISSPILDSLGSSKSFSAASQYADETSESTRRALVVDNDQFFAGDIVGDQPLSKETDASGRLVLEMLTPEQASQKLRQNEQSYLVGRGQGVVRYDVVQLASNNPIEDDHVEKIVEREQVQSASSDWMFWGVFDGHSGWTTSAKLRQALVSFVARELNSIHKIAASDSTSQFPSPEAIDAAIKKGFIALDNDICHESVQKASKAKSKRAAVELLAPAFSGSCALLSFYDSRTKLLRVACTGDSRAVLGRKGTSGKWVATPLSEDQTGGTPSEIERIRREHPGEEYATAKGRILGQLEPSRAFGDAIYKWSRETAMHVKSTFFGRTPSPLSKTPPYVTAEPIITTTKVDPEKGDFLVMATDGLWECLTNEEVIGLVGQWIDSQRKGGSSSGLSSWFRSQNSLPVENHVASNKKAGDNGQRPPIRQDQWQVGGGDERFVVEDKNAATHLIRNALGGKDRDMVSALLTLPSPYSRRYRDDLTVEVIFFGQGPDGKSIVQNLEASAPLDSTKPRL